MLLHKKSLAAAVCTLLFAVSLAFQVPGKTSAQPLPTLENYDPRPVLSENFFPASQKIIGPCWAFACIHTLEVNLNKLSLLKNERLSPKHMLSWANQKPGKPGWHINNITDAGYSQTAIGYLASGTGPIFERDLPYNTESSEFSEKIAKLQPRFRITGIKKFKGEKDEIKRAITEFGAVACAIKSDILDFHAISIIGWDKNGWITADSGYSEYSQMYQHVAFGTELRGCYCITSAEKFDEDTQIHQHDNFDCIGMLYQGESLTCANVFNFTPNETLEQVMFYSGEEAQKFSIFLAEVGPDGSPCSDKKNWKKLVDGVTDCEGYVTIPLSSSVEHSGKNAIILVLNKPENLQKAIIGIQSDDIPQFSPASKPKKSFLADSSGRFSDLQSMDGFSGSMLCIKAITRCR